MKQRLSRLTSRVLVLSLMLLLCAALTGFARPLPAAPGFLAPAAAPAPPVVYTVGPPLLVDGDDGRLYAMVLANGQEHHIGVFSEKDGRTIASFPFSQPFTLDAKGNRLFVISGPNEISVIDAKTGNLARTLRVPGAAASNIRPAAPQFDPQTGQLHVFHGNTMTTLDPDTGKELGVKRFDVPVQDRCRMPTTEPLPINRSYLDAENRLLYLEFTTYSCIPWIGLTIVAYDLNNESEISRQGTEPYNALAEGGSLYVESWHRFGIGTIWTERKGKPEYRSTGWSGGSQFILDARRNRLYQSAEGSIRIFDPGDMRFESVVPQPVEGTLAAFDAMSDQVYFVDGEKVRAWPAAKLASASAPAAKVKSLPGEPVRLVVTSPTWSETKTLFAVWSPSSRDTSCYVFNQSQESGPLLFSRDGGKKWLQGRNGLPGACGLVAVLAISPGYATDRTLLAGVRGNGVFKSTDGGTTWRPSSQGLPHMGVLDLTISPGFAADRTAFAAVPESGLLRSVNGGEAWEIMPTAKARLVALSPEFDRDGTLALYGMRAGGGALQLSEDRGERWREAAAPSDGSIQLLSLAPAFAKWGVLFAGDSRGDIYRSTNRGQAWQRVLQAGRPGDPTAGADQMQIAYGPNEDRREIFLVVSGGRYEGETRVVWGKLYRSGDGGQTWAEMDMGKDGEPTALAISPAFAQDRTLMIGTAAGRIVQMTVPMLQ